MAPFDARAVIGPGHLNGHTSPVSLTSGVLVALLLLVIPGAIVARSAQLTWPVAVAVAPALTYGVVALAILPLGAIGVPWNGWTALLALLIVVAVVVGLRVLLDRWRDREAESLAVSTSGFQRLNPSGYVESQGDFAERVAREMRPRTKWECRLDCARQTEFEEPRDRHNTQPVDGKALGWDESAAWDEFAQWYMS